MTVGTTCFWTGRVTDSRDLRSLHTWKVCFVAWLENWWQWICFDLLSSQHSATANDRKQLAVNLAREYAEDHLEEEPDNGQPQSFDDCPFKPGDFVAVVEEHSKLNCPKVLIRQFHSLNQQGDVSLLWYKNVSRNLYKLELSGEQWTESLESLVPVTVKVPKNRPGLYQLCTSPRQIHKVVFAD